MGAPRPKLPAGPAGSGHELREKESQMGRVRWSHVTIALALIAALAIAAPAIGGPSLKKLVKKEVSKQISKATGPAGPPGVNGTNGVNGADGTARAYALVKANAPGAVDTVDESRSKNITDANVTHPSNGSWCFNGLPFTPVNAVANSDATNHVLAMQGIYNDAGPCIGDEQASVTETVGNTNAGANEAFFIVFN